jgi:hypothetical protein
MAEVVRQGEGEITGGYKMLFTSGQYAYQIK